MCDLSGSLVVTSDLTRTVFSRIPRHLFATSPVLGRSAPGPLRPLLPLVQRPSAADARRTLGAVSYHKRAVVQRAVVADDHDGAGVRVGSFGEVEVLRAIGIGEEHVAINTEISSDAHMSVE